MIEEHKASLTDFMALQAQPKKVPATIEKSEPAKPISAPEEVIEGFEFLEKIMKTKKFTADEQ